MPNKENPAQGIADFARANGLDRIADAISPKGKEIDTCQWCGGKGTVKFTVLGTSRDVSCKACQAQPKETDELALIIDRQLSSLYCMIDRDHNIAQPEAEYDQALSAIRELIRREVVKARDSEQNTLFSILRHLGVQHDAKKIMKVRRDWQELSELEK